MDNKITNIKERVLQIAKIKGVSYELFSQKIGMTYSSFKGDAKKTPLNSDAIVNVLSEFPDVNPEWLLTGKGDMLKGENVQQTNVGGDLHGIGGIGHISGGNNTYNSNSGKDKVIEKQEEQVRKSYDVLVEELHRFHDVAIKREDYIKKQDEYIATIVSESYNRNERNMDRIDKLVGIISQGRKDHQDYMVKSQEQIDRMLAMLEKKL